MRNKQLEKRSRFDLRMLVFYVAVPLFMGLLLLQVLKLQWFEHDRYMLQAEQNRLNIVPTLPVRGEVIDAEGRGLAVNRIAYHVQLIPERVTRMDYTLHALANILHWSDVKLASVRKRIEHTRADRPVLLDDKLQWEQVSPLAARLHHFPGVDVESGSYRQYPYGALASHVIGYLSLARKGDLDAGYFPSEFVGRTGVEKAFEQQLHGVAGYQQEEVDAVGRRVAVLKRAPSKMGQTLQLALDIDIQQAASDALGDRTGAVVVLDVHTGAIIALLSKPGYDTNRFITGLESDQWNAWLNDPEKPLLNRAMQAAYPPASTFKLVTGFAGLEHHARLATGSTFCPGFVELADRKLRCWKHSGHGKISMHQALVESCDVFFYELGDELGMSAISDAAQEWGLGEKTGIELSPESRGSVPSQSPYMMSAIKNNASKRKRWFRGETMITAIGQGTLTTTPLQIARLAAAIANGGKVLKPQLLAGAQAEVMHQVDVSAEQLNVIRKAMRSVVSDPHGTAHRVLANSPWDVAGKTGTAQVIKMSQDRKKIISQAQQEREYRDHAWFMGYAPYKNPKIAIAVLVEHGGHGGSAAGPVAAAVIRAMAAKDHLVTTGREP
ncbi:penicillin-binding protein 2 [Mariprofundus ferrooxydans]|uniref:Penicillin-binding protein 2 n=1 Tax=Mariprofundus ferrooxydans PV-1 TaxID=314345 RepID=Q0EWK9_9PROT|nr:penicillin-binding protein 2 [Mariprofundus ferrooxydans]EAU53668.1 penicillin-binding protein 2 [Mariprofundus ferrooxydans PV-1]KON47295.1 penicillin-binding protein 2 [Mariprofundus ferrooxydans]